MKAVPEGLVQEVDQDQKSYSRSRSRVRQKHHDTASRKEDANTRIQTPEGVNDRQGEVLQVQVLPRSLVLSNVTTRGRIVATNPQGSKRGVSRSRIRGQ
eukprot:scaffold15589_cov248-Alexandrium_tamarense.AAC.1